MKKLLQSTLFLALLMVYMRGAAQTTYQPISDGCTWSVSNEKYMTAGDTVLDGKTYLKIYRQVGDQPFEFNLDQAEYFVAIRNDTAERKVYAYLPAGTWVHDLSSYSSSQTDDAMEVLLYDFSLELGDTVTFYMLGDGVAKTTAVRATTANIQVGWSGYSSVSHQYNEGDSLITLSDNTTRSQVFLRGLSNMGMNYVWMEGIGSIRGFSEGPQFSILDYGKRILLCFSDGSGSSFQTEFDLDNNPDDCFNNGFGGDVTERAIYPLSVHPNPTADLLHIELSGAGIAKIALYDLQGRVVWANHDTPQQGTATLNMRSVPAGMYLLRVTDADGKEYLRKIVRK
jgi:hypothetical protein